MIAFCLTVHHLWGRTGGAALYEDWGEAVGWTTERKAELLNTQDTVLCSYFAQRSGEQGEHWSKDRTVEEAFQGLDSFI